VSSANASLMMWAQRVVGKRLAPAYDILDLKPGATVEQAQSAFHRLARLAHPDLHRNTLTADELELLTAAYAIVAGAYHSFRAQGPHASPSQRMIPIAKEGSGPIPVPVPISPSGAQPAPNATQSMSPKALGYYRKAELALKRGDLKSAMLQLKLAVSSDPGSGFLRSALAEVEQELKKG
jgi:hypothetical protein